MFKTNRILPFLASLMVLLLISHTNARVHTEEELTQFILGKYEQNASANCYDSNMANWVYETDITPEHSAKLTEVTLRNAAINKEIYAEWFADIDLDQIKNATMKRLLKDLKLPGSAVLSEKEVKNLSEINTMMVDTYSTAKICPYLEQNCDLTKKGLNLEPEIESILSTSTDYDELAYAWKAWHDASGKKIRNAYKSYVDLNNKMARGNNFSDYGAYWRDSFDTPNFIEDLDQIWQQVRPLYKQLHSYAADKLKARYGDKLNASDGLLPAHIFGNMWAQSWENLQSILTPYPNETVVNITQALIDKKYTVLKMFETADDFYTSLGLPTNKVSFGEHSVITRPEGKEILCHASAWDFCDRKTFLIKMCTEVDAEDFITVHHEMGHIQYYILYKNQLNSFREGANPGFHEAVGDTMALSVKSIKHLKTIDLVSKDYVDTKEADINGLMQMALEKVAFLPFGYLIDKYRWDVFSGKVSESEWNKHWWDLRAQYQLVKPPVERSETDFDPGAKFHVAGDSQYISYFVSHILQFQFYRQLCIAAGEYNPKTKQPPLNQCDFYKNTKAGDIIKEALSLGSSKPWPEVLQIIAGTDKLDASALLEYFEPLSEYFKEQGYNSAGKLSFSFSIVLFAVITFLLN